MTSLEGSGVTAIHVLGEAVADCIRAGDGDVVTHPGGSAANVAYGLAKLGRPVSLDTQLGADAHGALITRHLVGSGVQLTASPLEGARTPSAVAVLDDTGAASYALDVDWRLVPDGAVPGAAGHLHVGSFAMFLGPGTGAVEELLRGAHEQMTTSLDPNVRPGLLPPADEVRDRLERLLRSTDVVKASDQDLAWLYPGTTPAQVAENWLDLGPTLVVVTMGERGAFALTRAGRLDVSAPKVAVADTVGAGDSFMSALLDGLARASLLGAGRSAPLRAADPDLLRAVLTRSAHAAAITVGRPGANPPTAAELAMAR